MLDPVFPFLSIRWAGLVLTLSSTSLDRRGGLCSWAPDVLCTWGLCSFMLIPAMASIGGATGRCCCGTWPGGGPRDLPRPTTGATCWAPSPGRDASPPPRPRPRLLPLALPVIFCLWRTQAVRDNILLRATLKDMKTNNWHTLLLQVAYLTRPGSYQWQ